MPPLQRLSGLYFTHVTSPDEVFIVDSVTRMWLNNNRSDYVWQLDKCFTHKALPSSSLGQHSTELSQICAGP